MCMYMHVHVHVHVQIASQIYCWWVCLQFDVHVRLRLWNGMLCLKLLLCPPLCLSWSETPTKREYSKKKGRKGKKKGKKRNDSEGDELAFSRPTVDTTAELPEVRRTACFIMIIIKLMLLALRQVHNGTLTVVTSTCTCMLFYISFSCNCSMSWYRSRRKGNAL